MALLGKDYTQLKEPLSDYMAGSIKVIEPLKPLQSLPTAPQTATQSSHYASKIPGHATKFKGNPMSSEFK